MCVYVRRPRRRPSPLVHPDKRAPAALSSTTHDPTTSTATASLLESRDTHKRRRYGHKKHAHFRDKSVLCVVYTSTRGWNLKNSASDPSQTRARLVTKAHASLGHSGRQKRTIKRRAVWDKRRKPRKQQPATAQGTHATTITKAKVQFRKLELAPSTWPLDSHPGSGFGGKGGMLFGFLKPEA